MTDEKIETEKQQIINAIGAALDALTQFEWYRDENHPCKAMPIDIRENLRVVLNENKLLQRKNN